MAASSNAQCFAGFLNGGVGTDGGHYEKRTFIERWVEILCRDLGTFSQSLGRGLSSLLQTRGSPEVTFPNPIQMQAAAKSIISGRLRNMALWFRHHA